MSRILLDTQLVLWALSGDRRLPKDARALLDESEVFVSAASIWEIAIKAALGKLEADAAEVRAALGPTGFAELPVTGAHAECVARLPLLHRDPFDRMLVAQSQCEPLVLLTADGQLAGYGGLVKVL
ncbi:MAG: type II toxin-antitoxin system VapC family toxin [Vicinamibacterales bacterium]|jgi:PIN domain nuclease of toxin-antitoxin system|nr:type II toxin-antitoxin system VapC family toxin [Vicinamibacterales bacterium]